MKRKRGISVIMATVAFVLLLSVNGKSFAQTIVAAYEDQTVRVLLPPLGGVGNTGGNSLLTISYGIWGSVQTLGVAVGDVDPFVVGNEIVTADDDGTVRVWSADGAYHGEVYYGPGTAKKAVAVAVNTPIIVVDSDGDGIPDSDDNCPTIANPDQEDCDVDGIGDACEMDSDGDSVVDDCDNCPILANADQADCDEDGIGDACEVGISGTLVATPSILWPVNHKMVDIALSGITSGNGAVTLTVNSVTSNEDMNGLGYGNTEPDASLSPLQLRAERSGKGSGRIYTILLTATDCAGNTANFSVGVTVPHDRGK